MSSSPSDLLFSRAAGTFKLIQLPTELSSVVQDSLDKDLDPPALVFKGDPSEDAVLCTHDKTYAVRSVVLSNTMLVVTPPTSLDEEGLGEHERVVIRDQLHDILELNPIVPRLDKIWDILSGTEYDENDEGDDNDDELVALAQVLLISAHY
jgi:sister chromatid cohesion protein DCC1